MEARVTAPALVDLARRCLVDAADLAFFLGATSPEWQARLRDPSLRGVLRLEVVLAAVLAAGVLACCRARLVRVRELARARFGQTLAVTPLLRLEGADAEGARLVQAYKAHLDRKMGWWSRLGWLAMTVNHVILYLAHSPGVALGSVATACGDEACVDACTDSQEVIASVVLGLMMVGAWQLSVPGAMAEVTSHANFCCRALLPVAWMLLDGSKVLHCWQGKSMQVFTSYVGQLPLKLFLCHVLVVDHITHVNVVQSLQWTALALVGFTWAGWFGASLALFTSGMDNFWDVLRYRLAITIPVVYGCVLGVLTAYWRESAGLMGYVKCQRGA